MIDIEYTIYAHLLGQNSSSGSKVFFVYVFLRSVMLWALLVNLSVILFVKRMRTILTPFPKRISAGSDAFSGWNIPSVITISTLSTSGRSPPSLVKLMLVTNSKPFSKRVNFPLCVIFLIARILSTFDEYWFKLNSSLALLEKLTAPKCVFLLYKPDVCTISSINSNWSRKESLVSLPLPSIRKTTSRGLQSKENANW